MVQPFRYLENLRTLKKRGGLVSCDVCGKLIGDINVDSCTAIQLYICCSCGAHGKLQFSDKLQLPHKIQNRIPGYVNKKYVCSKCHTPLLSVIPARLTNYGFYVECTCGEAYDTRVDHDKHLAETLQIYELKITPN